MNKNNKFILIILIIITVGVLGLCIYSVLNNNEKETDAIRFRNEYSELNGKTNESNGRDYINVNISETNTVKYVSEKKAVSLLQEESGIIYFGFSACPWCRSLVSSLTSVAESKDEPIYYLDILDIRSSFELKEGKISKIKDGTDSYYKILEVLDEELEDFYLMDDAGNKYDTGEKRLYAPTLVAFNKGEITKVHVGTVESQEDGYNELTTSQVEELEKIITDLIDSKNNNICTDEKC